MTDALPQSGPCALAGCTGLVAFDGLCLDHIQALLRSGVPAAPEAAPGRCGIRGCPNPPAGEGYCDPHWKAVASLADDAGRVRAEARTKILGFPVRRGAVAEVDLGDDLFRARWDSDPAADAALDGSIARDGLLNPPLLEETSKGFRVVAGHRRTASISRLAAAGLGSGDFTARVAPKGGATRQELWQMAFAENHQREWQADLELGLVLEKMEKDGVDVAAMTGLSDRQLRRYRAARAKASPPVAKAVLAGRIALRSAERLAGLDAEAQASWLAKILDGGWSDERLGVELRKAGLRREAKSFEAFLADPPTGVTIRGSKARGPYVVCFEIRSREMLRKLWMRFVKTEWGE